MFHLLESMATTAREGFLSEASVSLQDSAPSLSQQLRLASLSLQNLSGVAIRSDSERYCPTCGSLDIDSKTVEVRRTKKNTQNSSTTLRTPESSSIVIYKCRVCSRSKKVPVQETGPTPVQKLKAPNSDVQLSDQDANKERDSKVQKTSSKKRAKERKDREGLQALLSKKPDSTRPTNSFDLMDFMLNKS